MRTFERILVPVDFSDDSQEAANCALDLARRLGAEVRFFHALSLCSSIPVGLAAMQAPILIDTRTADDALNEVKAFAAKLETKGVTTSERGVIGLAPEAILDHVEEWKPSLLVMGSKGRTGLPRILLGSVAETVLRRVKVPVMVVHAPAAGKKGTASSRVARPKAVPAD